MKINLRAKSIEDKEIIKGIIRRANVYSFKDDSLYNNLLYINDVDSVLYCENAIGIEYDKEYIFINKTLIEFMSINQNEKE